MFFSGMETGMVSIDRFRLGKEAKSDKRKKKMLSVLEDPSQFLGVTLIGNNIANVVVSSVFAVYFANKIPHISPPVATVGLTITVLIFGEIIPKSYFRESADRLVVLLFPILQPLLILFQPLIKMFNTISSAAVRIFNIDKENRFNFVTREDLTIILTEPSFNQSIEQPQRDMLEEVMEFSELTAKNGMTPRLDIVAIESETTIPEVIKLSRKEGYTRYPVYKDNVDQIIGVLIIYDLIEDNFNDNKKAKDFAREALFVPETIDIAALLKEMRTNRKSMAIVVDSYGGTAGLITTEDIVEELIGDIEDEYDMLADDEGKVKYVNENTLLVKGDVEIDYLNDNYDADLPEGDYETIAGLIIERLMKIPSKGQKITVDKWKLEIMQATNKKIVQVMMTKT